MSAIDWELALMPERLLLTSKKNKHIQVKQEGLIYQA